LFVVEGVSLANTLGCAVALGLIEASKLGTFVLSNDGSVEKLGPDDDCSVGKTLIEGFNVGSQLGTPENDGRDDGCSLSGHRQ